MFCDVELLLIPTPGCYTDSFGTQACVISKQQSVITDALRQRASIGCVTWVVDNQHVIALDCVDVVSLLSNLYL